MHLIGVWVTDPEDIKSLKKYGHSTLEFTADGMYKRVNRIKGYVHVMEGTYRTEKGRLFFKSRLPLPEAQAPFEFTGDGKLIIFSDLKHGSRFIKKPENA